MPERDDRQLLGCVSKRCVLTALLVFAWPGVTPTAHARPAGSAGSDRSEVRPTHRYGTVWLVRRATGEHVPQPSISVAVGAADDGDVVLLSDGVFRGPENRDVLITDKDVEIRSQSGDPSRTVIDCESSGRAFFLEGPGVTNDTLFYGLTIARGSGIGGGGIFAFAECKPRIDSCVFVNCSSGGSGGGLLLGAAAGGQTAVIRRTVFRGNESAGSGAGAIVGANALVDRCLFVGNDNGVANGGGIALSGGRMRDSVVVQNKGFGGVFASGGATIDNCVIADTGPGGASVGLALGPNPGVVVRNTTIWGNVGIRQVYQLQSIFPGNDAALFYCNVEGGQLGIGGDPGTNPVGFDLIDADPLFAEPLDDDYSISPLSPCRDAGDPSFVAGVNEGDIHSELRVNGRVDIGADEVWDDLSLTLVAPGRVGERNEMAARGAVPGTVIVFFASCFLADTPFGFGLCPDLMLGLGEPALLLETTATADGSAGYSQHVSPLLAGETVFHQAVELDLAAMTCRTSPVVPFTYP